MIEVLAQSDGFWGHPMVGYIIGALFAFGGAWLSMNSLVVRNDERMKTVREGLTEAKKELQDHEKRIVVNENARSDHEKRIIRLEVQ